MRYELLILLAVCAGASAQSAPPAPTPPAPTPPAPAPAPPCQSEAHRQFDFWVGTWDVTSNGQPAGTNEIQLRHRDCVLHESWTSAAGTFTGNSLNAYDAARGVWHQTWADSSGTVLHLDGGFADGVMTLRGERPAAGGSGTVLHQIQWTPQEDGSVRQVWTTSADGGENWQTAFDGLYRKAGD